MLTWENALLNALSLSDNYLTSHLRLQTLLETIWRLAARRGILEVLGALVLYLIAELMSLNTLDKPELLFLFTSNYFLWNVGS